MNVRVCVGTVVNVYGFWRFMAIIFRFLKVCLQILRCVWRFWYQEQMQGAVPRVIENHSKLSLEGLPNHQKWGGSWKQVGFRNGPRGIHHLSFGALLAPLGGFGDPFGRPLDFEGVPKSIIFVQDQHKSSKKWPPGAVPEKTWNYDGKLMRKWGALSCKKEVFSLYLL